MKRLLLLRTGLFPDAATVAAAVAAADRTVEIRRIALNPAAAEADWDAVVQAVLWADLVVAE